jgi:hypothetical protein
MRLRAIEKNFEKNQTGFCIVDKTVKEIGITTFEDAQGLSGVTVTLATFL